MAGEDTTKSTPFIVGMVFFGIGVILLIAIIIIVMYFCIYRRRKNQFEKKKYLTMDNSIIYTKSPPSLDLRPPSISREVNENGNIQTMTTMSPLDSPNTIYTVDHGPPTPDTVFVSSHDEPTKLSQSFDTVDHHSNGKKYMLREVYAVDGGTTKKKNKGHKTNKNKQHRVGKAHSSYHSWNNRRTGGSSLPRTKPRKDKYSARSERGYRTTAYTNGAYHHHTDTLGSSSSKKLHKGYYGSAPTLVRLQPVSFATMPTRVSSSSSSSQRMYLVSDNPRPVVSPQSVILNRSPPRSPRSPRFAVAHSLDGYNNYEDHDHMVMKSRSHNTSRDYGASPSRDNSTDGNILKWSPSMRGNLEDKGRVSRSNSDLTSISRTGRKRGIGEHKYIYDPKHGTLEQF